MKRIAGVVVLAVMVLVVGLGSPAFAEVHGSSSDCGEVDCADVFGDEGTDPFEEEFDNAVTAFGVIFVLAVVAGVGITLYKMSTARQIASEAGMDPERAATMTLLSDDGLDATYLAASLRDQGAAVPAPPPARTTRERLEELEDLRRQGLVTEDEYAQRRASILDAI